MQHLKIMFEMNLTNLLEIIIILFAVWNGLVIIWGLVPDKNKVKKISDYWHATGLLARALLCFAILLDTGLFNFWISILLSWHLYDIIINLIRGLPWHHTGTNFFDRAPFTWLGKGVVLAAGLIFLL